ncbi:hypothetical protein C5Y97_16960 [Blastopirellula marina]|uniref:YcxB-like protein domain-containing protein n=1 Tax=Blastopirellula marina TaxID=124 RepID=A0A2S8FNZ6_9BACT|nr:hypothetical protein C5Y98_16950 [Blastopirellula marina]PTL43696.1 hypothetical protein C5Y97_16960 [Blastopirellula marina]
MESEEADANDLALGRTVATGHSYVTFSYIAFVTIIGIFMVALSGVGMIEMHAGGIALLAIVMISVGAVVHFAAVYSGKHAPLLISQTRIFGSFTVKQRTEEMEVSWSELVAYEFDRQGYLHLEARDGAIYTIYVGWYSEPEQEQLHAFCRDRMRNRDLGDHRHTSERIS